MKSLPEIHSTTQIRSSRQRADAPADPLSNLSLPEQKTEGRIFNEEVVHRPLRQIPRSDRRRWQDRYNPKVHGIRRKWPYPVPTILRKRPLFLFSPLSITMTRFLSSLLTGSLVLLLTLPLSTQAQDWRQEVQIVTTIPSGTPLHVFLDSMGTVLEENPELRVQRSPNDTSSMKAKDLRAALYEEGLDLTSATHAFIRYRFDLPGTGSGVVETIQDIHFIFRLDESRSDLSLLYLNTRDPMMSRLLVEKGIPSPVNMMSVTPFRKLLAFPVVTDRYETAVVEFGGQTVREGPGPQQASLLSLINEHLSVGTYVLTTIQEDLALATP